mgnify:CR=1 FL=1
MYRVWISLFVNGPSSNQARSVCFVFVLKFFRVSFFCCFFVFSWIFFLNFSAEDAIHETFTRKDVSAGRTAAMKLWITKNISIKDRVSLYCFVFWLSMFFHLSFKRIIQGYWRSLKRTAGRHRHSSKWTTNRGLTIKLSKRWRRKRGTTRRGTRARKIKETQKHKKRKMLGSRGGGSSTSNWSKQ